MIRNDTRRKISVDCGSVFAHPTAAAAAAVSFFWRWQWLVPGHPHSVGLDSTTILKTQTINCAVQVNSTRHWNSVYLNYTKRRTHRSLCDYESRRRRRRRHTHARALSAHLHPSSSLLFFFLLSSWLVDSLFCCVLRVGTIRSTNSSSSTEHIRKQKKMSEKTALGRFAIGTWYRIRWCTQTDIVARANDLWRMCRVEDEQKSDDDHHFYLN